MAYTIKRAIRSARKYWRRKGERVVFAIGAENMKCQAVGCVACARQKQDDTGKENERILGAQSVHIMGGAIYVGKKNYMRTTRYVKIVTRNGCKRFQQCGAIWITVISGRRMICIMR